MLEKNDEETSFTVLEEWRSVRVKAPAVLIMKEKDSYVRIFHKNYARFISPKPEPEKLNFDTEQIIAICWAAKRSTGYGISATSVTGDKTETIVTVKTHVAKGFAGQMITYPAVVLKVKRTESIKIIVTGERIPPGRGQDFFSVKKDEVEVIIAEAYKERSPYFEFSRLDNSKVTPEVLKGRVVVLYFWSTWCGPCLEMFPVIEQLYQKYKNVANIFLFAVYCHAKQDYLGDSLEKAREYVSKNGYEIPFALDFTPECGGLPRVVVIDKSGYIRVTGILPNEELIKYIDALLKDTNIEDAYQRPDTKIEKRYASRDCAKKISAGVWRAFEESPNDKISVAIDLVDQADSTASTEAIIALSRRTQPPVLEKITHLRQGGHTGMGRGLVISNSVLVDADITAILELAAMSEVKTISSLEASKHPVCL